MDNIRFLQYIGARYVPKFYVNSQNPDSSEWEANVDYEYMTWVSLPNGHMYLSKEDVPASVGSPVSNPRYWMTAGQFNAYIQQLQTEINDMQDGTVSGSLQNQIDTMNDGTAAGSLQNQINTISGTVATQGNTLTTLSVTVSGHTSDINRLKKKKIIFIGDSYMAGDGIGGTITNFVEYFSNYASLAGIDCDVYYNAYGGYGFKNDEFKTLLENANIGTEDPANITDIIVLGGINDTTLITTDSAAFLTYMRNFTSYAHTTYPNAKVRVGYISKSYTGSFEYNKQGIAHYKLIGSNGGSYINGVENILRRLDQFRSDGHPSADGQQAIARNLVTAVFFGSCNPSYPTSAVAVDPASGRTLAEHHIEASASNGTVTISSMQWCKYGIPQTTFSTATREIFIGYVTSGLVIGDSAKYKYIPVRLILVRSGGSVEVPGSILVQNKSFYISVDPILNQYTDVTDIWVAPFSHTLDTADI